MIVTHACTCPKNDMIHPLTWKVILQDADAKNFKVKKCFESEENNILESSQRVVILQEARYPLGSAQTNIVAIDPAI